MAPYTSKYRNQESKEKIELSRQCTYDLMSVVVHVGEIETGHYISFCRVNDQVRCPCLPSLSKALYHLTHTII